MGRQRTRRPSSHKDQRPPRGWRAERAMSGFWWKNQRTHVLEGGSESGVIPALPSDCAGRGSPPKEVQALGRKE